jgi:hypothetical protein
MPDNFPLITQLDQNGELVKLPIVGFFDIIGTSNAVMSDRFSDGDVVEFVNPIGIAAYDNQAVRFAVFSDSLIISTELSEISSLLRAINLMYGNWFSENIYVRGAISCGEIFWVDHWAADMMFRCCPNITYVRVYGKGLVTAYELEQRSGPGAICFLTEQAAKLFLDNEPCSVIQSHTPLLCWATERQAKIGQGYAKSNLERIEKDTAEWRHAKSTKHYWDIVVSQRKFLPDNYAQ